MNMLKEFVIENAKIIDNLEWRKLADKIQDSGLDIPQIERLTDILKETTRLEGLPILWCHFCSNKTIESFIVPDTVTEMSFNVFYNSEIGYLKLSPNTVKIDTEAFYNSSIQKLEMWSTNPIKILGSRLPKNHLGYIRYHGSLITILERIDISDFHCTIECDDGYINLDPGFFPEVTWHGDSGDAKKTFQNALTVMTDEGLVVKCADGKTAVWDEDGEFEIV